MYSVIVEEDPVTGFRYADVTKGEYLPKPDLKLIAAISFDSQSKAVHTMLKLRKETCIFNFTLDPNYVPRRKKDKITNRGN